MNWDVFRAYDIRGIYPEQIDEEAYYRIAKGYVYLFKPTTMVVGMDARLSSPSLKASLIKGFLDAGVDVIDIGQITTDMLYYVVGASSDYSGGVVVSASHNPKEYNGMKMVREKAAAISSDTGLFDIRDALKEGKNAEVTSDKKGTCTNRDILDDYLKHVLKFIDRSKIKPFTFVGNANFGFVCRPAAKLAQDLGLNLIPLNFEPDGSFPKGPPDPMLPGNRTETEALVRDRGATFGVIWDADADRAMFVDEKGEFISGAYITALLADILLTKYGSNKIIFDPRVIWPTIDVVKRKGGTPIISKGGHAFIKDRMRRENALFAGELSGHYYFRENFYADNGVIPFLLVLEHLSTQDKPFSEIMKSYMAGHYMSGELNYRVKDIKSVIEQVRQKFHGQGEEDFTDGYSLETAEWRFNIRGSNTEPLLRLNIEARKPDLVDQIRQKIEKIINS